jgi:hypothetical protein
MCCEYFQAEVTYLVCLGVGIATRLRAGFDSRQGLRIFLSATASRPALGPIQPPVQWVPAVKRPRREADHSFPSSAEVKNACSLTHLLKYVLMAWCLVKHRRDFTSSLPLPLSYLTFAACFKRFLYYLQLSSCLFFQL